MFFWFIAYLLLIPHKQLNKITKQFHFVSNHETNSVEYDPCTTMMTLYYRVRSEQQYSSIYYSFDSKNECTQNGKLIFKPIAQTVFLCGTMVHKFSHIQNKSINLQYSWQNEIRPNALGTYI